MTRPLVSIITPFFNTEAYLAECIESVLAQTYDNWEYILVDNKSTDSSRAIAERYARRDSRIRLFDTPRHLTQIQNYEAALRRMSGEARYCKIVQADDRIFPPCVARMVEVAEGDPRVGIVSSYQLFGEELRGRGLPETDRVFSGHEVCRRHLLWGEYYFGTPTSVLVRADLVRAMRPFFDDRALFADMDACYRVLIEHDFGFVPEALTYSRTDNDSITARIAEFKPHFAARYVNFRKFGRHYLDEGEHRLRLNQATTHYLLFLARCALERKNEAFWRYQWSALRTVGCTFWTLVEPQYVLWVLARVASNPGKLAKHIAPLVRRPRPRR